MPKKHKDRRAAFWAKVDSSGGTESCWPWLGYLAANGYGQVKWKRFGKKKMERSHRVAFFFANGWMPYGVKKGSKVVRHTCDNRRCCNPQHLLIGTQKQNIEDAMARGRLSKPPISKRTVRTPEVVEAVKGMSNDGVHNAEIARRLGIGWTTVQRCLTS